VDSSPFYAFGVEVQSTGKIVIAGQQYVSHGSYSNYDFALARYNSDGTLDSTFGTSGVATVDFGSTDSNTHDYAYAMTLAGSDKLVVTGRHYMYNSSTGYTYSVPVARLMQTGHWTPVSAATAGRWCRSPGVHGPLPLVLGAKFLWLVRTTRAVTVTSRLRN